MKLADDALLIDQRHRTMAVHGWRSSGARHVVVLMAVYNGAAFLQAQLESLAAQLHEDWSLIVSDDGSTDDSLNIIEAFALTHPERLVSVLQGPGKGFAQNFLALIRAADPNAPFVAFCDQDDVWLPHKLWRALERIGDDARPTLYGARTEVVSQDGVILGRSPLFARSPAFENALVQSIAGGNTMVLNRAGLNLLQRAARGPIPLVSHDWWAYQVISGAGGHVDYDPEPGVQYRQHDGNLVGSNHGIAARLLRLKRLLSGEMRDWTDANLQALRAADAVLTPENRAILARFAKLRRAGPLGRLRGVLRLGLYRQTRMGQVALILAAVLRKI